MRGTFRARATLRTRLPGVDNRIGVPPMCSQLPMGHPPRAKANKTRLPNIKSSHGVRQIVASIDEESPGPASAEGPPLGVFTRPARASL